MKHETVKHYSQEAELFEGFLDPYMKYSSAMYASWDEPLDAAVRRLLDLELEWGNLKPNARILEIGNGWGSFLRLLEEAHPEHEYVGVNPSAVQLGWIREHVGQRGTLIEAPFEEVMHEIEGPFDAVYMLGSICHMKDKLAVMQRVSELLAEEGRLVMEDTFFLSEELYQAHAKRQETRFVQEEIFGYAHVYSIARHLDELRKAGLHMVRTIDNSDHYARSIEIWTDRLQAMDSKQFPLAPKFIAYMDVFQRGWNHTICNHVMAIEKLPMRRRAKISLPTG